MSMNRKGSGPRPGDFKAVFADNMQGATVQCYQGEGPDDMEWRVVASIYREDGDGEVMVHIANTDEAGKAVGQTRRGKRMTSGQVGARRRFFETVSSACLRIRDAGARKAPVEQEPVRTTGSPASPPSITLAQTTGGVAISAAA